MAGSKPTMWQERMNGLLEGLVARPAFVIGLNRSRRDAKLWVEFAREFSLPEQTWGALWHYGDTGELDPSLIDPPNIHVIDEAQNTYDGLPMEMVIPEYSDTGKGVYISLDPNATKTVSLAYIAARWEELIEPSLKATRGGNKLPPLRPETYHSFRKRVIYEMRKTMKPQEIAIKMGLAPKQVTDMLYRENKKYRHLDTQL